MNCSMLVPSGNGPLRQIAGSAASDGRLSERQTAPTREHDDRGDHHVAYSIGVAYA
jgi:hypothetical protein